MSQTPQSHQPSLDDPGGRDDGTLRDDGDGYSVAPEPEGDRAKVTPPPPRYDASSTTELPAEEPRQFTLGGLLLLFTLASLLLAVGRQVDPPIFAGLSGLLVTLTLLLGPRFGRFGILWQVGWWMLLLVYLMAIVWVALIR